MARGEHLHNNSENDVKEAKKLLEEVKVQEKNKMSNGFKEVRLNDKFNSVVLRKIKQ